MPCRSDYLEPNARERESAIQAIAKLSKEELDALLELK